MVTQSGFWPGSIRDMTYVFDQDLLLYWDLLQKQVPGVSERSFLKSLERFSKRLEVRNPIALGKDTPIFEVRREHPDATGPASR